MKIWIIISLCHGSVGNDEKKITNVRELFIYHVISDQNDVIYDYLIVNAVQWESKYKKKKKKKRKKKVGHFGHGEKNNE